MQLSTLHLLAVAAAAPLTVAACASSSSPSSEAEGVASSEDELTESRQESLVGKFDWNAETSGSLVDFEHLELEADGTYAAKVEATLVNAAVRCFRFPCTLPEEGTWSTFKVGGKTKLRVRPSTGRARVYSAAIAADGQTLTLSRRGETTTLFREARITCANVRCAAGTHCEMTGAPASPECVSDKAEGACVKTGCSGHVCADHDVITTCQFRPEYTCYQDATCERQADGQCGWTQTPALSACLAEH